MKILICGDRNWSDSGTILLRIERLPKNAIIISGGARGADTIAELIARSIGMKTQIFPAQWNLYGKAAGPIRNQQMLEENPDLVIAFHNDLNSSKGTKDMINRAKKAGIPTEVISN